MNASDLLPKAPTISVGAVTDVGAVAEGVAAVAKIVETVQEEKNTPAEIQAALELHAQQAKNALQRAIEAGDIDALRRMAAIVPEGV